MRGGGRARRHVESANLSIGQGTSNVFPGLTEHVAVDLQVDGPSHDADAATCVELKLDAYDRAVRD
jgi:hypothetical protein